MNAFSTALLVAVAGPVGVVVILLLSAAAAAALAAKINPAPQAPVDEQVRRAVEDRAESERMDLRNRELERQRRGASVDSTHVSFPAFGVVFAVMVLLQSWGAAVDHFEGPGEGLPLALALRPLWTSVIAALIAGAVAGHYYRRWYRRQSKAKQIEIEQRRRAEERRGFEDRLRSIRGNATRRRKPENH